MSVAVTTLVNDVTRACDHAPATQWMMVLDDYHAIGRPTYTKRHCSSSTTCPPTSPRQPDEIRDFLLRTAVLDQVSGPLCDAVTGRTGGTATLEDLERGNLSSGPVGHPAHLVSLPPHVSPTCFVHVCSLSTPDQVPDLHRRASAWYSSHSFVGDAVRHAADADRHGVEPLSTDSRRM